MALSEKGVAQSNFAALKNAILTDDRGKSAAL
jgi:hypothetical protein